MTQARSRNWDQLVQQQLERAVSQIAADFNRKIFFYPRGPMFFIFTTEFGIEPILFSSRERAEAEVLRLQEWAAYRHLEVGVAKLRYRSGELRDGTTYELSEVIA